MKYIKRARRQGWSPATRIPRAIRYTVSLILTVTALVTLNGCHEVEEYDNDPRGNFEALWKILDEHYCFFEQKDVDWNEVYDRYSRQIDDKMTSRQLFWVCAAMLDELRDGHTNLSAPFETSYYRKWWSDYPQNFNERLIQQNYFNFNYSQLGAITYGTLLQGYGYIGYSTFSSGIGEGNLDYILAILMNTNGLIIDVRNNGGGTWLMLRPLSVVLSPGRFSPDI